MAIRMTFACRTIVQWFQDQSMTIKGHNCMMIVGYMQVRTIVMTFELVLYCRHSQSLQVVDDKFIDALEVMFHSGARRKTR